ncbi:hypothetical protein [Sphaerisporangium aureirubrum]|uniref:Uncharacterized protein n=1 Tax=Sphaerisporangium aureirubrum TaxID=1544736 RepID=A0ABW1NXP6_9ACTN
MSADQESATDDLDTLLTTAARELDDGLRAGADLNAALLALMAGDAGAPAPGPPAPGDTVTAIIAIRAEAHGLRRDLDLLRTLDRGREHDRHLDRPRDPVRDLVHDDLRDGMLRRARDLVCALDQAGAPGVVADRAEDLVSALTLDRDVDMAFVSARALTRTLSILDALGLPTGQYASVFDRFGVLDRVRAVARTLHDASDLNSPLNWAVDLTHALERIKKIGDDVENVLGRAGDVLGTINLVHEWKRVLSGAYRLEEDLSRAYPYDLTEELIRDVIRDLIHSLETIEVDASGLDLRHLDLHEVEALTGVLWTLDTAWPPAIATQVRARSTEITPGTYRVHGRDTQHPVPDHPAPAH